MTNWDEEIFFAVEIQPELPGKFHKRSQSKIVANETYAYVELTKGEWARIDIDDWPLVAGIPWACMADRGLLYARYAGGRMHTILLGTPKGFHTDHKDGNGLNNSRSNIRVCTVSQNQQNKTIKKKNKTGFVGVRFDERHGFYEALITVNKKQLHLGTSPTASGAHKLYRAANLKYFGEFSKLHPTE